MRREEGRGREEGQTHNHTLRGGVAVYSLRGHCAFQLLGSAFAVGDTPYPCWTGSGQGVAQPKLLHSSV